MASTVQRVLAVRTACLAIAIVALTLASCAVPHAALPDDRLVFPMTGRVGMLVPVVFAGKEYLFSIDTGAGSTFLDEKLVGQLGPKVKHVQTTKLTTTQDGSFDTYRAPVLQVGGVQGVSLTKNGTVGVMDFSTLRTMQGQPIMGILGMDYLRSYTLRIDYPHKRLEILDHAQPPAGVASFAMTDYYGAPAIEVALAGLPKAKYLCDSGDDGDCEFTEAQIKLLQASANIESHAWSVVDCDTSRGCPILYITKDWSFAGTTYQRIRAHNSEVPVLGSNVLSNYVVTFDFPRKRVYFQCARTAHPVELWQGFMLQVFGIDNHPETRSFSFTRCDETAHARGIMENDELVTIDGLDPASLPIDDVFHRFDGTRRTVLKIKRQGAVKEVVIEVGR